ncbi:hypothetical protein N332_02742, partial [Mesitornis unicolor]
RNTELLSKAMSMHKNSENMNDPSRLSAVLQRYAMLRLHDWEKLRSSATSYVTYETGSIMIKKLFDACEEDTEQRITNIFEVLDFQPLNDAMTNTKQGGNVTLQKHNITKLSKLFSPDFQQAGIDPETPIQQDFSLECCKIYCLLLLQDPPVKAVWNLQESSEQHLEHVDKK